MLSIMNSSAVKIDSGTCLLKLHGPLKGKLAQGLFLAIQMSVIRLIFTQLLAYFLCQIAQFGINHALHHLF